MKQIFLTQILALIMLSCTANAGTSAAGPVADYVIKTEFGPHNITLAKIFLVVGGNSKIDLQFNNTQKIVNLSDRNRDVISQDLTEIMLMQSQSKEFCPKSFIEISSTKKALVFCIESKTADAQKVKKLLSLLTYLYQ
jgi:hypothetical protein